MLVTQNTDYSDLTVQYTNGMANFDSVNKRVLTLTSWAFYNGHL